MPFLEPLPHLTRPLGQPYRCVTVGDLRHTDGDVVPSGFRTDLASVPRALHWLLPPDGPYEAAAVRHDAACNRINAHLPGPTPRTVDAAFHADLRSLGMGPARAALMWLGVRYGAALNPARRPGIRADLPLMLALTVAALWLVVPTLICQLAVTALDLLEPAPPADAPGDTPTRHDGWAAATAGA